MHNQWWTLPGPSRFVDRVVKDLRQSKNVVIGLPNLIPDGIRQATQQRVKKSSWRWCRVTPQPEYHPLDQLYETLTGESTTEQHVDHFDLAKHDRVRGTIAWIDLGVSETPETWVKCMKTYADSIKRLEPDSPLLLIGVLQSDHASVTPNGKPHLSVRTWRNVIRVVDVRNVVERELRKRSFNPTQHQLAVETIARVALWDLQLAAQLAFCSLAEITDPFDLLEDYAHAQQWSVDQEARWEDGTHSRLFGEPQTHSALCVLQGNLQVVERRIWAAQTGVVLPFLEARLRTLISRLDPLPPTWTTTNGTREKIVKRENYELSHVAEILSEDGAADDLTRLVRRLKDMRNRLAHLESLRPADLEHLSLKAFNTTLNDR
jgi:hypothetical protein